MELGWRNDVESLSVEDEGISETGARSDEDRLIKGLKWNYCYFDRDQADGVHVQIVVPEIHKEEEIFKKDLTLVVPDEHSEAGDHHHHHLSRDYSDSSDNRCYLKNKREKQKRPRIQIFSDEGESSEGFTRMVPSVTRKGSKRRRRRRRRDEMMRNKMRTLQKLVPNCHKTDKVSVLDKTIDYMRNLQLQLQVMSIMGMNPYIPLATLNFGMHNQLWTAMALSHGLNSANQATSSSSPLIPASIWPSPPFTNILPFPHSSDQFTFLTTESLWFRSLFPKFP